MSIALKERELYTDVWQSIDQYAEYSPGEKFLPIFLDMIPDEARGRVLDAGCGSGKGAVALRAAGFDVTMADLTPAGLVPEAQALPFLERVLWDDWPQSTSLFARKTEWDWVYCSDVMEHIPTPFAMLVVRQLLSVAKHGVFFSISLMPDHFGVMVGHTLHHTIQSFAQWRDQLNAVGHVVEARDLLSNGIYLVTRRT